MSIFLSTVLVLTLLTGSPANATNTTPEVPHEANLTVTPTDPLDIYIEFLAFQESSGREDVQIIDTNGEWSRGCLQFQDATIQSYARKFHLPGEPLDCRYQKALARQILLREPRGWANWFNSVKSLAKRGIELPLLDMQTAGGHPVLGQGH
jgi:hypothetical protein